jgi:Mannosyl-glycoprotein endo-beta-N-acetylglucosaminidase
MPRIPCGSAIAHFGEADAGVAGCLVQFPSERDKLYLLTAGHVVWSDGARQGDLIEAKDLPGARFGMLFDWSVPADEFTTTDAALIRVDPALASPNIGDGNALRPDPNLEPKTNDVLTVFALGHSRSGRIRALNVTKDVKVTVFGESRSVTYRNQIECECFTAAGSCGVVAVDKDNRIVGMVIAGDETGTDTEPPYTLITPINALLSNPAWDSDETLAICTAIPDGVVFPPPPPANAVGKPAFVAAYKEIAIAQGRRLGTGGQPPGIDPRIILAQAALETGWGKHAPDNNFFGIKGQGRKMKTLEADGHGGFVQIVDSFRGYPSPEASFIGYADFLLANQRYRDFLATGRAGRPLPEQTAALQASGYATDPRYALKVLDVAQAIVLA